MKYQSYFQSQDESLMFLIGVISVLDVRRRHSNISLKFNELHQCQGSMVAKENRLSPFNLRMTNCSLVEVL